MKVLFTFLLALASTFAFGQFPQNPTTGGTKIKKTEIGALEALSGVKAGVFTDTSAANANPYMKGVPFILFSNIEDNALNYRSKNADEWIMIMPFPKNGSAGSVLTWLSNNRAGWLPNKDTTFIPPGIDIIVDTVNNEICIIQNEISTCYPLPGKVIIRGDTSVCLIDGTDTTCGIFSTHGDTIITQGTGVDSVVIRNGILCVWDDGASDCTNLNSGSDYVDNGSVSIDSLSYNLFQGNRFIFSLPTFLRYLLPGNQGVRVVDSVVDSRPSTVIFNTGWTRQGDAIESGQKLGTTNDNSLKFITNNINRLTLDTLGRVRWEFPDNIDVPNLLTAYNTEDGNPVFNVSIGSGHSSIALGFLNSAAPGENLKIVSANSVDSIIANAYCNMVIQAYNNIRLNTNSFVPNEVAMISEFNYPLFTVKGALTNRGVYIGSDTSTISSAKLIISSTTQGLLLPRLTKAQRDAIVNPVAGLILYQTDNTPGLRTYNGTNWVRYSETID